MNTLNEAKALSAWLSGVRRELHMRPEVGLDLPVTAALVMRELDAMGVSYKRILPSGIKAVIGKGEKRILLRGDMDALPIKEETGLPYSSLNEGNMHACGHDMHTAMLLGAARLLKAHEDALEGEVVLMFQPGEEGYGGAPRMIEAGLLEPMPDCAVALHMAPMAGYPSGALVTMPGAILASSDTIEITVRGIGGHGAEPHLCKNPIAAAMRIVGALDDAVRFELPANVRCVFSVCEIHAGTAPNVIPETCVVRGTLRMMDEEKRAWLIKRFAQTAAAAARLYGTEAEFVASAGMPVTYNDAAFTEQVHGYLTNDLPGALVGPIADYSSMGSEDFSCIAQRVPSCYLYVVSQSPPDQDYAGHSPHVVFDDEALPHGAAAYAQIAMSYLGRKGSGA